MLHDVIDRAMNDAMDDAIDDAIHDAMDGAVDEVIELRPREAGALRTGSLRRAMLNK